MATAQTSALEFAKPFYEQIRAGRYDRASIWEEVKGQVPHEMISETCLDDPRRIRHARELLESYGDKMASLSELLHYAMSIEDDGDPKAPIVIVWKRTHEKYGYEEFWAASFTREIERRSIGIYPVPSSQWFADGCRFLVRKQSPGISQQDTIKWKTKMRELHVSVAYHRPAGTTASNMLYFMYLAKRPDANQNCIICRVAPDVSDIEARERVRGYFLREGRKGHEVELRLGHNERKEEPHREGESELLISADGVTLKRSNAA